MDTKSNNQALFGVTDDTRPNDGLWFETTGANKNGTISFSIGAGKNNPVTQINRKIDPSIHEIEINTDYYEGDFYGYYVYYDGNYHYIDSEELDYDITRNLLIGLNNKDPRNPHYGSYRIYSFNIYDSYEETIIASFVPAVTTEATSNTSTGQEVPALTYGLYELESKTFYPNKGTGTITCDDSPIGVIDAGSETELVLKKYYYLKDYTLYINDTLSDEDVNLDLNTTQKIFLGEGLTSKSRFYHEGVDLIGFDSDEDGNLDYEVDYYLDDPDAKIFTMPSHNVEFETVYEPHVYGIRVKLNGGTGVEPYYITNYLASPITIPNPTRDNYEFAGWKITGMDEYPHYIGSWTDPGVLELSGVTATDFACLTSEQHVFVDFEAMWTPNPSEAQSKFVFYKEDVNGYIQTYNNRSPFYTGELDTNVDGPGSFVQGIDLYSTYLPSEGFDDAIDDTFIDIDDDSNIDVVKLDYIETHFEKADFYYSLDVADLYKKDLFDVQYIDTGLMSQDVYKVDMNVNTSVSNTFDSGTLDSFLYSSDALFAAVQGRKLSDIADSIPATMIGDWSPIKGSGLSLFLEIDDDDEMLSALYLGGDKLTENDFPTGMMREYFDTQSGDFADFFHIVAERDSKFKTLSVGYGLDSETELISKSSVSGIENNIPFTLFGANYDDVIVGSNLMFSGVKIYGKDDVLLRDFIPAVAVVDIDDESYISDGDYIEQGTIGLYDLVEGKFYPNAGTGNFTFDGYTPGIAGIADVGSSGDGFNQFNVIYKRNVHTAYFITPYILKGSKPALYFSDEAAYEKLLENDDVIVAPNGMLCRLLEKKDYRYEQPIEAPSDTFDLFNRSLIGWTAFTTDDSGHLNHYNDSVYDSSASDVDGFFDPYYFENDPFTMIDEDIYFVAETYSLDQHNSPKINLDVSYIDEEGTPIYEVKPNQVISLLSDEPNTVIRYVINSIPIAMFANDDYSNSFAVTTDMFDADGYCYIYACVTSNIEDSGTEEGMFASMSPISCFVLHTDFWGDVTPEDLELSMDTSDPRNIPHGLWMAGGEEEYMKVYDPTVKEYKLNGNVYYYNTLLTEGKDYTISYKNNKKVGVASATIKCKGNYTGTIATSFNILPLELGEGDISYVLNTDAFAYKLNKVQKPTVKAVYYNMYDSLTETYSSVKLTNKTDYVVSFPDNGGNTGSFDMYITLKGNYTQENDYLEFADVYVIGEPGDKPISSLKISGIKDYPWNGDYIEQNNLVVKDGKNTLTEGIDYDVDYYNNTLPGVAVMVISGNGIGEGYIGSVTKTFKIKGTDISKLKFSGLKSSYLYDGGNEIKPQVTVKDGSTVLHEYDEYYVDYINNRSTGTATITFYGNPEYGYVGTKKLTFKIKGTPLSQYNKTDIGTYFYTGSPIEFEQYDEELYYTQKVNGYEEYYYLPRYNDVTFLDNYVLSYKNNINAGTATVTYTGVNAYSGTVTKTFKINALPLYFSNLIDVEGVDEDTDYYKTQPYQKGGVKPTFTITHKALDPYSLYDDPNADTRELVFGKDYTVTYKNNTKVSFDEDGEVVSEALAIVKGKGNYTGTIEIPFLIEKQEISNTVISIPDVAFTGKTNVKPSVSITDIDGKKLVAGSDYNKTFDYYYSFDSIVYDTTLKALVLRKAGEAVLTTDIVYPGTYVDTNIEGLNNYTGSATVRYCVCTELINKASVTVRTQYCTGNGQPVSLYKEDISVKINGSLLPSSYYEIVGYENNTKAGTAKVTIKGKGYFGGEKTVSFKIVNKPVNSLIFRFYSCSLDGDYWYSGSMPDFKVTIADLIKGSVYLPTSKINDYGYIYPGWTTRDYEYLDDEGRISIDDYYDLLQDYDGVIDLFPSYPY